MNLRAMTTCDRSEVADLIHLSTNYWYQARGRAAVFHGGITASECQWDDFVQHAAQQLGLEIKPDPRPEQESYFRTDHFPLAQIGIPAYSIRQGTDFIGKPPGFGDQYFREFVTEHYHQFSDEYHEDWDFSGLEELGRLGLLIGIETANLDKLPTWNAGDEYLRAREKE